MLWWKKKKKIQICNNLSTTTQPPMATHLECILVCEDWLNNWCLSYISKINSFIYNINQISLFHGATYYFIIKGVDIVYEFIGKGKNSENPTLLRNFLHILTNLNGEYAVESWTKQIKRL